MLEKMHKIRQSNPYSDFMRWCKISTYTIIAAFLILASCNFGVDDKKYPNYNGEVYAPKNLGETK